MKKHFRIATLWLFIEENSVLILMQKEPTAMLTQYWHSLFRKREAHGPLCTCHWHRFRQSSRCLLVMTLACEIYIFTADLTECITNS